MNREQKVLSSKRKAFTNIIKEIANFLINSKISSFDSKDLVHKFLFQSKCWRKQNILQREKLLLQFFQTNKLKIFDFISTNTSRVQRKFDLKKDKKPKTFWKKASVSTPIPSIYKNIFENGTKRKDIFCLCRKPDDGRFYVECEECEEWFHPNCCFEKKSFSRNFSPNDWKKVSIKCPNTPKKCSTFVYYHKSMADKNKHLNEANSKKRDMTGTKSNIKPCNTNEIKFELSTKHFTDVESQRNENCDDSFSTIDCSTDSYAKEEHACSTGCTQKTLVAIHDNEESFLGESTRQMSILNQEKVMRDSCTSCSTKAEVAKKSFSNVCNEQKSVDYNNLKDSWISQCTLQKLSNFQQKITEK